jgi:hypothetical protein
VLYVVGIITAAFLVGVPIAIGMWIWGLVNAHRSAAGGTGSTGSLAEVLGSQITTGGGNVFMASAIIAVVGTVAGALLGSLLSYLFQRRSVEQAQAHAFGTLLRAERLTAYGSLASALMDWRRAQADRYNRQAEEPGSVAADAARKEMFQLRSQAQGALAQVQLVGSNAAVVAAANAAFEVSRRIHSAPDYAEFDARAAASKAAVEEFVRLAAAEVQAPTALPAAQARNADLVLGTTP